MTRITPKDVRKVAKLSRLDLTNNEVDMYAKQLEDILQYIEQLEQVVTDDIPETTRAIEVVNVTRNDEIVNSNIREDLLNLAPNRDGDFFKVPKILNE